MKTQKAVVDACNLLYLESPRQKPSVRNIFGVMSALRASGREPIVILDRAMASIVGDMEEIEELLLDPGVISIPPGSDAARMVLETAEKLDAIVVSNNTYVDYWNDYPWVELCRLPVAIVNGGVSLLDGRFKNAGHRTTSARKAS